MKTIEIQIKKKSATVVIVRTFFSVILIMLTMSFTSLYGQTQVSSVNDLAAIGQNEESLKGNYKLTTDLTVDNWTPIGNEKKPFIGTFDGDGHTITIINFQVDTAQIKQSAYATLSVGLFGSTGKGSLIKNLRVAGNLEYDSNAFTLYMGGIVGDNGGTVRCCVSTANINARGGLYSTGRGLGQMALSGLAGGALAYLNEACGGGVVGLNRELIENCYATGCIVVSGRGVKNAGGLAGRNGFGDQNTGKLVLCYASGPVSAREDGAYRLAGGLVASCLPGNITNCVALNDTLETIGNGKGITVSGMGIGGPANVAFGATASNFQQGGRGAIKNVYYRNDMIIYMEKEVGKEKSNKNKGGKGNRLVYGNRGEGLDYTLMVEQDWWISKLSFAFGTDESTPWIWNDDLKRPVLHWEMKNTQPLSN